MTTNQILLPYNHPAVTRSLFTDSDETSPTPSRPRINRVTLTTHPGRFPKATPRGTGEYCHQPGSWAEVHVPRIPDPSSRRDGVRPVPAGRRRPRNSGAREAVHERTGPGLQNLSRVPSGHDRVSGRYAEGRRQGCLPVHPLNSHPGGCACPMWKRAATASA